MRRKIAILLTLMAMVSSYPVVADAATAASGVVDGIVAGSSAHGGNGRIVLTAGYQDATFSIYSITGQLIKTVKLGAEQRTSVDVPKGFYVVKCAGQWSRKVVVK